MKIPRPKGLGSLKSYIIIISYTLLFAALLFNFSAVLSAIGKVLNLASPFFAGFAIAFLLFPVQRGLEKLFRLTLWRKDKHLKLMRCISTLLSLLLLVVVVVSLVAVVVPELIKSMTQLANTLPGFIEKNSETISQYIKSTPIENFLHFDENSLALQWDELLQSLLNNIKPLLTNIISVSTSVFSSAVSVLVSLITAFYILFDHEIIAARIKKAGYAHFNKERFDVVVYWTQRAKEIFNGFISGKIIDSLIIGVICYFFMLIVNYEYPLLISCVIGLTNIIPFFGPFIGWIPTALILLLINPMHALWFSLFILILQQVVR